jgi:hypothetical protein
MASLSISPRRKFRFDLLSFFESSMPSSENSGGRITAAATTGPARQPLPASSHPASIKFLQGHDFRMDCQTFSAVFSQENCSFLSFPF